MIVNAIKSPNTLNFEEILLIESIQLCSKHCKQLLDLIDLFLQKDIQKFKTEIKKLNKLLQEKGITKEEAILKKQYIQICSIEENVG